MDQIDQMNIKLPLQQWLGIAALGETRAGQELAKAPLLHHHHAAAEIALHIGNLHRQLHMAYGFISLLQSLLEGTVEASQQVVLLHLALGNAVQLVLQVCRELHINDILEILLQHIQLTY